MIAAIRLDIMTEAAECDTCPALNENMARLWDQANPNFPIPTRYPSAIYRLTIGAGFRQPTHLCPDCLKNLRDVLGVSSGIAECNKKEREEIYKAWANDPERLAVVRVNAEHAIREGLI